MKSNEIISFNYYKKLAHLFICWSGRCVTGDLSLYELISVQNKGKMRQVNIKQRG